ncbi:MAG: hypothetical protein NTZ64_18025 [Polaromonas sp.]|nr:hypothetical protein [Polaromonas sp.]
MNPSERIREAIGEESVASFSRRSGIGDSTIRKYLDGALPNSINLVAIADAANVNIEWLATGRGPKMRGAPVSTIPLAASSVNVDDLERLELAVESVEEGLAATHRTLPPSRYAQLIVAVYDLLADMDQKDNVIKFIKLAA